VKEILVIFVLVMLVFAVTDKGLRIEINGHEYRFKIGEKEGSK